MRTSTSVGADRSSTEEMSFRELFQKVNRLLLYLIKEWRIITVAALLGGILGSLYAYSKKIVYSAEGTFVLEEQAGGSSLGQYAGLASMVGVDILNGGGSGLFQGDNIIQLYRSRLMIQKTLLSEAIFGNKRDLLISRYISFNNQKRDWWHTPQLENISFENYKSGFSVKQDSILGIVVNEINKNNLIVAKPDKKLSIISVKVNSKDELFAKEFTGKLIENVNSFYVATRTKKAMTNLLILQKQADSVRQALNKSLKGSAIALDANPNLNVAMQTLRVPSQEKQIDVQANMAIYSEIVKNLEIARISLRKETPLIQMIDTPILPLPKTYLGIFDGCIIGMFIFIIGSMFILILRKIVNSLLGS